MFSVSPKNCRHPPFLYVTFPFLPIFPFSSVAALQATLSARHSLCTFTRLVMTAAVAPSVSTLSNTLTSMDSKKIAKGS